MFKQSGKGQVDFTGVPDLATRFGLGEPMAVGVGESLVD
jgi:hypothetical protein